MDGLPTGATLLRIMESNTLSGRPRAIMNWLWVVMLVLAALVAIGSTVFG